MLIEKVSQIHRLLLTSLVAVIIASCANQQAPSGGPPDTTPPVVTKTQPQSKVTNFDEKYVEVTFSKYMNKTKVVENLFVTPTTKTSYKWSGKSLKVNFDDELRPNTTYSITLGTEYTDFYNNKPDRAYSIVFSTGNELDSGKISGRIYGTGFEGTFVFAYNISDMDKDTFNITKNLTDYKVQVGSSGLFEINALPDGTYRVVLIDDKFKDNIYNPGIDSYSFALSDVVVASSRSNPIKIMMSGTEDTSPPKLLRVDNITKRRLDVLFSESIIKYSEYSISDFAVSDSASGKEFEVIDVFPSYKDSARVSLLLAEELTPGTKRFALNREATIRDTNRLSLDTTKLDLYFKYVERNISDKLIIQDTIPQDSSRRFDPREPIQLVFNYPVEQIPDSSIRLYRMRDTSLVEARFDFPSPNLLQIKPLNNLTNSTEYLLKIAPFNAKYDFIESAYDTMFLSFETDDLRNYSVVEGRVNDLPAGNSDWYIVMSSPSGKTSYQTKITDGKWKIEKVAQGEYSFMIFEDRDGNAKYSQGSSFPFNFAEPFYNFQKTINVKSRWDVEEIILKYEESN